MQRLPGQPALLSLSLCAALLTVQTGLAAEPDRAYSMRASVFKDGQIVAFASWIAYENRVTTIKQDAATPYASAIPLSPDGKAAEGTLSTTLDLTVRPWRANGELILNVDLNFNDVAHMNRYRYEDLLEELPTNSGQAYGGDYEGRPSGEGWRFDLAGDPESTTRAIIDVVPAQIVEK